MALGACLSGYTWIAARARNPCVPSDKNLTPKWTRTEATDALWTLLLVPNWENLTLQCGWSTEQYVHWMKSLAERTFVDEAHP